MMTKRRLYLLAAVVSSVSSLLWLANCVVDVIYSSGSLRDVGMHGLLCVIWGVCAVLWWCKWRQC